MKNVKLTPMVGYIGGKRRLLPSLRPHFDPSAINLYAEPFVGMGALYLDLRIRGYRGPAVLADANPCVAEFWRVAHDQERSRILIGALNEADTWPTTTEHYKQIVYSPVDEPYRKLASFLWLTNFAYGNAPPRYTGSRWTMPGTSLTSAAKWGKKFPWRPCIERFETLSSELAGLPCEVHDDGLVLIESLPSDAHCFCDPPYLTSRGRDPYANFVSDLGYAEAIFKSKARTVFTEALDLQGKLPPTWRAIPAGTITARISQGGGASGGRQEWIYTNA